MTVKAKNNRQVFIRKLDFSDYNKLFYYLQNLSEETKNRSGPHSQDFEPMKFEPMKNITLPFPNMEESISYNGTPAVKIRGKLLCRHHENGAFFRLRQYPNR